MRKFLDVVYVSLEFDVEIRARDIHLGGCLIDVSVNCD